MKRFPEKVPLLVIVLPVTVGEEPFSEIPALLQEYIKLLLMLPPVMPISHKYHYKSIPQSRCRKSMDYIDRQIQRRRHLYSRLLE